MPRFSKNNVVVAGHICLDIIPNLGSVPAGKFLDLFKPGLMIQIGPPTLSSGGPVSNTGLALHILGMNTRLMGKIGDDMYGHAVLQILEKFGTKLSKDMIIDPSVTTSYTIIISPPGIDRMFLHHSGANNTFCSEDVQYDVVEQADIFHFGYPPVMKRIIAQDGEELTKIFQRAKTSGVTTSLDMCFPDPGSEGGLADWRKILSQTLPFVDIFSPSIEEILFSLCRETYNKMIQAGGKFLDRITPALLQDISQELMEMGAKIVLLKLGDRGLYLRTTKLVHLHRLGKGKPEPILEWENQELWTPCFEVDVVGTTGSGDATIAGFLSAILRDYPPRKAITSAVAVGAFNVEAADALSGLRSWEVTQERIQSGWQKRSLKIDGPGWFWDDENSLWLGPAIFSG